MAGWRVNAGSVERWVMQIIDRAARGLRIEDDRVELKRQLPTNYHEAARRIAGHANQVREDRMLWVIGVEDRAGSPAVPGLPSDTPDPDDWWRPVEARFDSLAPAPVWVHVEHEGKAVLGLGFETDRSPYVVKVSGNGPSREVPWREGTHVRSANRYDLLRLLVPVSRRPVFTILEGSLSVQRAGTEQERGGWRWDGSIAMYVETLEPLMLPDHMCSVSLSIANQQLDLEASCSTPNRRFDYRGRTLAPIVPAGSLVSRGDGQLLVEGSTPLAVLLSAETEFYGSPVVPGAAGRLAVRIGVAGIDRRTEVVDAILMPSMDAEDVTSAWSVHPAGESS